MPGVPQLEAPTEQMGSLPVSQAPVPGAGAFGASAAQGLEQAGKEVFEAGFNEFQKTSEMLAVEANTQYQISALDARKNFEALHGHEALTAFPSVVKKLQEDRQRMMDLLPSKTSQKIFANSTLRQMRIEQSVIETHFDSERNILERSTNKNSMDAGAQSLALMGARGQDPTKQIEQLETLARMSAKRRGLNDEEIEDDLKRSMQVPLHALVKAQGDAGNPQLQETVQKYGQYLTPQAIAGAEKALTKIDVANKAKRVFAGVPLVNALGKPDSEGSSDTATVLEKLKSYSDANDPHFDEIEQQVQRRLKLEQQIQTERGAQKSLKIQADSEVGGGFDLSRASEDDKEALRVTRPDMLLTLIKSENAEKTATSTQGKRAAADMSAQSTKDLRANLVKMSKTDPNRFSDMTPLQLVEEMSAKNSDGSDKYGAFTPADLKSAPAMLKQLQDLHTKDQLGWIDKAVTDQLKARVRPEDRGAIRESPYYSELVQSMTEAVHRGQLKAGSPAGLDDFFKDEFKVLKTGGFFVKPTLKIDTDMENRAARKAAPQTNAVVNVGSKAERDKLAPGTKYRRPNDPNIYTVGGQ